MNSNAAVDRHLADQLLPFMALAELALAEVKGNFLGSREVYFSPKSFTPENRLVDIGTAGSVTLFVQALLLPSLFSGKEVYLKVKGGTNVSFSPPAEAFSEAFFPLIEKMNAFAGLKILKRGYYPKGQGLVEFSCKPCTGLKAINLTDKGQLKKIKIYSTSASLPEHVALNQFESAKKYLVEKGVEEKLIEGIIEQNTNPSSIGSSISCLAFYENSVLEGNALGAIGKPAEKVGLEAAESLWREMNSNAAVDRHLADQLLPFMALAEGASSLLVPELTSHVQTSIEVLEKFLPVKFSVEELKSNYLISVKGIAFMQLETRTRA
ncbi:RNA 3'-phosphate cyclase [archaeon]|nr:RNA 3'-phosphate cyclase [archaeon]